MKINDSNMEEFGFQDWHSKSHLGPFLCKKTQAYYKIKIPLALTFAKNRYISLKYSAPRLCIIQDGNIRNIINREQSFYSS